MTPLDEIANRLQERSRTLAGPLSGVHRQILYEEGEQLRAELQAWRDQLRQLFLEEAGQRGWVQTAQSGLEIPQYDWKRSTGVSRA